MATRYGSIAGVVFGFRRPDYLQQTVAALENNTEAGSLTWYAFLDGAVNPISGNRYATDEQIEACYKIFSESELDFQITRNEHNECITLQKHKAHQLYDKHDAIMFFEDDLITSPHYIRLLRIALRYYPYYVTIMNCNKNSGELNQLRECKIARIWGYGMSRKLYKRIEVPWTVYAEAMKEFDYLLRSTTPGIRRKLGRQGIRWHSHDITITRLSREYGKGKLWPRRTRGRYIGKEGAIAYRTPVTWHKRQMHKQPKRYIHPSDAQLKRFFIV